MSLMSRFSSTRIAIRSSSPLSDDQIMRVAPSIYAEEKHDSRSDRYSYIPTSHILAKLKNEGFMPFFACQTRCRDTSKREHTKHMLRLRHANTIQASEANEIVLLNSHDGTSSFQLLSGVFRFVCANGMVCGDVANDVRVAHKGNIVDNVIEGAFRVLDDFEQIDFQRDAMKSLPLSTGEQSLFARAALALRYDENNGTPAPITETQLLTVRRSADQPTDLWTTFNRVQENLLRGGLVGRNANGRKAKTREVTGIDQNVKLNRALWILTESMRQLKAA
jgi:hypothetical protein